MEKSDAGSVAATSRFLESCEQPSAAFKSGRVVMVIFGGAGDLAQRKLLPALHYLYKDEKFLEELTVLGVGHPDLSDEAYRLFAASALEKFSAESFAAGESHEFLSHLYYLYGSLDDDTLYQRVCERLEALAQPAGLQDSNIIFYLAIPPQLYPIVVEKLKKHGLCRAISKGKLIVEKPFGKDRNSATDLNRLVLEAFDEKQIYRIDHYLAKDTVQNILFFRFGNSIFEPLWNTRHIDHVQITVAESIGIEHRGSFYEQVGVVRDIVQNHLMQLLALVAMEPPVGFEADLVRDEKVKVFRSVRRITNDLIETQTVRGQYAPGKIDGQDVRGYREEDRVSPSSNAPTFFAGNFFIDNWRWAGVPFYLRTGKRLPRRLSEIYIEFQKLPLRLFGKTCEVMEPNSLILSIQPEEEISLRLTVKYPGMGNEPSPVNMEFNYQQSFRVKQHPAYERLLIDCIRGDLTLFSRQDEVDLTWSILDPLIERWETHPPPDFPNYPAGSWGPDEAFRFMEKEGRRWRFADERSPGKENPDL